METHKYKQSLNGEIHPCVVCGKVGENVQHHISHKRYSDEAIWVCDDCHRKIHANPSWSYQMGYLIKHNNQPIMKKETSKKSCSHPKTYWNAKLGKHICNTCGKPAEMSFGKVKVVPAKGRPSDTPRAPKMGYEKQDPRAIEVEKLKLAYRALTIKMKQFKGTPAEFEKLKNDRIALRRKMDGVDKSIKEMNDESL